MRIVLAQSSVTFFFVGADVREHEMPLQRFSTRAGDPPPRPEHFDERYRPPPHRVYPLSKYNWHPRDDQLVFHEEPHVYVHVPSGQPFPWSMTGVVHSCQPAFDPDAGIAAMRGGKSQAYPRKMYVHDLRVEHDPAALHASRGALLAYDDGFTVAALQPPSVVHDGEAVHAALLAVSKKRRRDPPTLYSFSREYDADDIKAAWAANGMDARNRGTEAHLQLQYAAEGLPFRADDPEVVVGLRYFDSLGDEWRAYRTEWEIWDDKAMVAGSIDLVIARGGESEDDGPLRVVLVDYKRSKDLKAKMRAYGGKKMLPPLDHLEDCDGDAYALQLSGYQYVLERCYDLVVEDRVLVSVHPDKPHTTSVPYLGDEIKTLFAQREALVDAYRTCPHRCPVSEVALHDPVRVRERDDVVDRKTAMLRGWTIERVDDDVRRAVEAYVAESSS
jgi:hypothetical protein